MAHCAGFAHDPTSLTNAQMKLLPGGLRAQREALAKVALGEPPAHAPGTVYSYSNTGYELAGLMVERVTGRLWEDVVREALFASLGMERAGFGETASAGQLDGLWGHSLDGKAVSPVTPGDLDNHRPPRGRAAAPVSSLTAWGEGTTRRRRRSISTFRPRRAARR